MHQADMVLSKQNGGDGTASLILLMLRANSLRLSEPRTFGFVPVVADSREAASASVGSATLSGILRDQLRTSRERSQRGLRPGKAATGPTTSHATAIPVP